jgi:hypothetical protein
MTSDHGPRGHLQGSTSFLRSKVPSLLYSLPPAHEWDLASDKEAPKREPGQMDVVPWLEDHIQWNKEL